MLTIVCQFMFGPFTSHYLWSYCVHYCTCQSNKQLQRQSKPYRLYYFFFVVYFLPAPVVKMNFWHCLNYFILTYPGVLYKCSLQPVSRCMPREKWAWPFSLYGLTKQSTILNLPTGHLRATFRFDHFPPTDSLYTPVRAIATKVWRIYCLIYKHYAFSST